MQGDVYHRIPTQTGAAICWQFWHAWFDRCQHRLTRSGLGHGSVPHGHTQLYGRHEGQWEVIRVHDLLPSHPGISGQKILNENTFCYVEK